MFSYPHEEPIKSAYPDVVPTSTIGYTMNNKYPGFPPLTADGRNITASYQPEAVLNENLVKEAGIKSNWQYRNYLTKNGQAIMRDNFVEASNDVGYFQRFLPSQQGNFDNMFQQPARYSSYHESEKPIEHRQPSDLKNLYLSKEQLHARRMTNMPMSQEEMLKKNYK